MCFRDVKGLEKELVELIGEGAFATDMGLELQEVAEESHSNQGDTMVGAETQGKVEREKEGESLLSELGEGKEKEVEVEAMPQADRAETPEAMPLEEQSAEGVKKAETPEAMPLEERSGEEEKEEVEIEARPQADRAETPEAMPLVDQSKELIAQTKPPKRGFWWRRQICLRSWTSPKNGSGPGTIHGIVREPSRKCQGWNLWLGPGQKPKPPTTPSPSRMSA